MEPAAFTCGTTPDSAAALRRPSFPATSINNTGTPALSNWAAIREPMDPGSNTAAFFTVELIVTCPAAAASGRFEDHGDPHTAADALRRQRITSLFPLEQL